MSIHILDTMVTFVEKPGLGYFIQHPDYEKTRKEVLHRIKEDFKALIGGFVSNNNKSRDTIDNDFIIKYSKIVKELDNHFNIKRYQIFIDDLQEAWVKNFKESKSHDPYNIDQKKELLKLFNRCTLTYRLPNDIDEANIDNIIEVMNRNYLQSVKNTYKKLLNKLSYGANSSSKNSGYFNLEPFSNIYYHLCDYVSTY